MTEMIFFGIGMIGLGFGLARLAEIVRDNRRTVSCDCGFRIAGDVIIVDPVDRRRLAELLSENCPVCRTNRRQSAKHNGKGKA